MHPHLGYSGGTPRHPNAPTFGVQPQDPPAPRCPWGLRRCRLAEEAETAALGTPGVPPPARPRVPGRRSRVPRPSAPGRWRGRPAPPTNPSWPRPPLVTPPPPPRAPGHLLCCRGPAHPISPRPSTRALPRPRPRPPLAGGGVPWPSPPSAPAVSRGPHGVGGGLRGGVSPHPWAARQGDTEVAAAGEHVCRGVPKGSLPPSRTGDHPGRGVPPVTPGDTAEAYRNTRDTRGDLQWCWCLWPPPAAPGETEMGGGHGEGGGDTHTA